MSDVGNISVVAGFVEAQCEVLLVHQQEPTAPRPYWALPGGQVEPGETLLETLARELFEETGLTSSRVSPALLFVTEVYDPHDATHMVAFVFRARVRPDCSPIANPGGSVHEARFVPLHDAIAKLEETYYLPMSAPPVTLLRGNHITFWPYLVSPLGIVQRIHPL